MIDDGAFVPRPCPFCVRIQNGEFARTTKHNIVMFEPLNPVTPGHMLFVPRVHFFGAVGSVEATGDAVAAAAAYGVVHEPPSFNVIINHGVEATQTVPHLHVHYVPRRVDDGLHLPWTGQVKT